MTFTTSTFASVLNKAQECENEKLQYVLKYPWHTPLPLTVAVALFLFTPRDYLAARQIVLAHWLSILKA